MKKLVLLIAVLALAGNVTAQQTDMRTKKFTFGPKIGMNATDLNVKQSNNEDAESGLKIDFVAGAFAEYRTCKWFAVSADLLYSRQGYETESTVWIADGPKTTINRDIQLQYLNIPILANFYFAKGWALKTGIQPGFLLGAKYKYSNSGKGSETTDIKDGLKSLDLAIPIGISYTFKMGLVLDLRYNLSLTNIAKDKFKEVLEVKSVKNYGFTFSAGWKF